MAQAIAVIGAGVAGLTAAIRLAEKGKDVELFEAAPKPGGRTRSFIDPTTGQLCDNGPHLLIGAYQATNKLLEQCGAAHHIAWQATLELPMWDKQRGFFTFKPATWMPFQLALLLEVSKLPGHHRSSSTAMLRLAATLKSAMPESLTVQSWMQQLAMPDLLVQDLIEPLCLGAMNESVETACALSFRRVLHDSFGSRDKSRLGWFTKPLDEALIQPLTEKATQLGVKLHLRHRVRSMQHVENSIRVNDKLFQKAIIALPAYASAQLLGRQASCETSAISNIHLWF
ncbi:MAG: FAD-dependent oxidoreductase, partial [Mariprofundus sp.]